MRCVFFLSTLLVLASAKDAESRAKCALDGAKAVSDMADAAKFLWASSKRCDKKAGGDPMAPKCEIDITAAIQAVNNMVMVMVSAANDCGDIHTENYKCGMAVGTLTAAASGLASNAGGIVSDCPGYKGPTSSDDGLDRLTNNGNCFVDGKTVIESLFQATVQLSKANRKCKDGSHNCARNALNIISSFSSMGSAIAAAVDDCSQVAGLKSNSNAACSSNVLATVSSLHDVADAGMSIAEDCKVDESRLYELEHGDAAPTQGYLTIMLAAFLPVSAVLSFVAGSRFSKHRQVTARDFDTEQLMPVEVDDSRASL